MMQLLKLRAQRRAKRSMGAVGATTAIGTVFRRAVAAAFVLFGQAALAQQPLTITGITPSGTNVPPGRQIVIQFNRPVVPIGRMDRSAAEIPIEISPALECQWRWLDTSALACQLGDGQEFQRATRYVLEIRPGIRAADGATIADTIRHEFVTERPRVAFVGFSTWRSPGTPVLRAVFTQPVGRSSVERHLFVTLPGNPRERIAVAATVDEDDREAPRFIRVPGEPYVLDFGERQRARSDDQPTEVGGDEARRVWLLTPERELPLDARVTLRVEPGLESAEGPELGDETRVAVEFWTYPEFRFLGVSCRTLTNAPLLFAPGTAPSGECNPLSGASLLFSAPVLASEVRDHVTFEPDLAGGRTDYDPWANRGDYSMLASPHQRGRSYSVWLPEMLKATQTYTVRTPAPADGPKDEFGRALEAQIEITFRTGHRPPDYTLVHPLGVLEQGVDSEIPLYVTNLDSVRLDYTTLTTAGESTGTRTRTLPDVEDVQYGIALGVREMIGAASGVLYGRISTNPPLAKGDWERRLFAEVTPYQVHAKLGHFNTLIWVADLATGAPVADATVSIGVEQLSALATDPPTRATAVTDASGIALLPGTRELDPTLELSGYGCNGHPHDCPQLVVRVTKNGALAVLPLGYDFEVNIYRASSGTVWPNGQREFGHLHAWGTTAQGVYRAGDTLEYKLYVRDQSNETYVAPPPGPYRLEIIDPTGQTVHTVDDITLSRFGAYSGTYAIPKTAAVGWYQFQLTGKFAGTHEYGGDVLVRQPMRVLVSDFTPSSFGVTTSLNGDLFSAGDVVTATARAALFSGGPYTDAEARITAQVVPKYFRSEHPTAAAFRFDSNPDVRTMVVAQHTGAVDSSGEATHTFTLPADLGAQIVYGSLTVEGAVRDDRGRYVASAASADFVAVDRLVGLRSTRWVFREDEPADVQYIVVDGRGTPVAGTDVHIDIERLETKAARVRGAGNAYLTQFVDEWVAAGTCEGRSTMEPQTCRFVPDSPGSYRLIATATDTRGRMHRTTLQTWVVGAGRVVWRDGNDDALEIVPEKAEYAIGETARYLVKNPYPGARALVTIERYGVLKQWVETLDSSTPLIEFEVEKDFMPGFYLSVLVMSPRVAAPPPEVGELDLGKPAFKLGYVAVPVNDPYKEIAVQVRMAKQVYKPGDTVRARISARPRERDTREPIEVAVAVLDEAVLDLIQGGTAYFDPYDGFYTLDGLDLRNFSLLTRLVGRQKIETKGANPGGDGGAALSMRSVFEFVSYWNPSLELDSRGNGEIEFTVPDNLTGWRILVLAVTPTDRMGLGQGSFKVNRPTEIRPALPNLITEGDRFTADFTVMNRTERARDIRVTLTAAGDVASTEPVRLERTVHLEPYQRTTVGMPLAAGRIALDRNRLTGNIAFSVTARDSLDGDGLRHDLTVQKRRSLETAASYGTFDGGSITEALRFPPNIHPDVGDVGAVLSPTVIGNVDGAFRYMRDYPYVCWEQQLSKGVMAAHYLRLRDYLPADLEWPAAAGLPQATLAQAVDFQAPNGGMAYFLPLDLYVSPYLSAYTALAFTWLRDDGYAIPENVEAKLHEYLDELLKRDSAPDFYTRGMASTVRAVALAALAKRGKIGLPDLMRYRQHVEYMSLFGKAHYLQAALAVPGGEALAREVETMILQSAVRSGGKISFNEVLDDGYLRISATPLNSSCAVLSATTAGAMSRGEIGPADDVPFELVRAITEARGNRDHWENTQENMFCVNALVDYAQRYESTPPNMEVGVTLDGASLGTARFTSVRDPAVTIGRPLTAADVGRDSELTVTRSGDGRLYYSARMSYALTDEHATAINAGVDLRKEISVQRNGEWQLLQSPMQLRRGELVRVDLFVSLPTARHFLVVDDPVPGALEPVNRDLANASLVDADAGAYRPAGGSWWFQYGDWQSYGVSRWSFYHQEIRHDAVRFYSDYLPPGNYHLSYTAQVIATGEFAAPPAKAVEMYDPDVYGLSAPFTLQVEAAQ